MVKVGSRGPIGGAMETRSMQIDAQQAVQVFSRLQETSPQVRQAVTLSTVRQALDSEAAAMAALLRTLEPTKGQHIDLRV
jgi:hypothetical protein